jgi:hypothetical protein
VVVVHVGDDHVLDLSGVDVECGEAFARVADDSPVAPRSGLLGKAGVDHEGPLGRPRHPQEEVERHRAVVDVAKDEVLRCRAIERGVFDREQLVSGR